LLFVTTLTFSGVVMALLQEMSMGTTDRKR